MERAGRELTVFQPETELERRLGDDPALQEGLAWGTPRGGHPEGSVGAHVDDLLERIEASGETGERRAELRLVALLHDSLKYAVDQSRPRTGENHHAMRARRFAERYIEDERLLAAIELHDRPYSIWRKMQRKGRLDEDALEAMLARVPDHDLFMRFVAIDGSTEGKDPEPVEWFRTELERRRGRS